MSEKGKKVNHPRKHPTAQETRQAAALVRQEAREKLGDAGQLARLNQSLPDGAKKEKARLVKKLEAEKKK